jgi:hypothetical protein
MRRIYVVIAAPMFLAAMAQAQPVPLELKTGGALIADMTLNQIYLTRDLDGNGDAMGVGEATVYFDETNASGLADPVGSVFSMFQSIDGTIYIADGGSDTIYALNDLNKDGDAQDAGEARIWFSADGNAAGYLLPTPDGLWQDDSGALYITNAATSVPSDAIYRTVDLNGDGDAEDSGEATLWFNIEAIAQPSTPFELVFIGDTAYMADWRSGDPDAVLRIRDDNGNGVIEANEWSIFIDDNNAFGPDIGSALVTDGTSLVVYDSYSSNIQSVYRLTDLDGSNDINDASEVQFVWDETYIPPPYAMGSSFGMAIGPGGELLAGSAGSSSQDNAFRLIDLNGDGDCIDAGETIVWVDGGGASGVFIDNPRCMEYIMPACPPDFNGDTVVNSQDFIAFLNAFVAGDPSADFNGDGNVNSQDFIMFLNLFVAGC